MTETRDFWSRRRAGVAEEAAEERKAEDARLIAAREAELEERSDEEILAELELPDPESLEAGDDFSVFMAKAVPDRIRRRALRKLWLTNPVLANVDQLVDYGEDFTDASTVVENLQTAYQVGKGMLKHVEELARQAEVDAEEETTPEDTYEPEGEDADVMVVEAEDEGFTVSDEPPEMADQSLAVEQKPRRMKFRIEETA